MLKSKFFVSLFVSAIVTILIAIFSLINITTTSLYEVFGILPIYIYLSCTIFGIPLSLLIDVIVRKVPHHKQLIAFGLYGGFGVIFGLLFLIVFPEIVLLTVITSFIVAGIFFFVDQYFMKNTKGIKYGSILLTLCIFVLSVLSFTM